jgi:hypothetical protein
MTMSSFLRRPSPTTCAFRPTLEVLEDRITPATAISEEVTLALIVVVELNAISTARIDFSHPPASNFFHVLSTSLTTSAGQAPGTLGTVGSGISGH